jgi:hypothetical protein
MPKVPDFHNWEFLSDAMFDDLPVFQHMVQQRDLDYKMRVLYDEHESKKYWER